MLGNAMTAREAAGRVAAARIAAAAARIAVVHGRNAFPFSQTHRRPIKKKQAKASTIVQVIWALTMLFLERKRQVAMHGSMSA
jgi:hypothetical protein